MQIPKDVSLEQLDDIIEAGSQAQEIILPYEFRGLRVGLLSRLVQAFITILKENPQASIYFPHLRFPEREKSAETLDQLLSDPHVLPAILMSEEVLAWDHMPIKRLMQARLVKRFESPVFVSGKVMQLLAIDHSIARLAYPESIYFQSSEGTTYKVRGGKYYSDLIYDFLSVKVRQSSFSEDELVGLGELVAELVENTEQHAKSEFSSGKYARSVRGVCVRSVTVNKDQEPSSVCQPGEKVYDYLESIKQKDRPLHFIELSVFDSGPGIAASYVDDDGSFGRETELVLESFKKGITSKPNGSGFGRGLDLALNIINQRQGFLSVRTGRLSLYRDFYNKPIKNNDPTLSNGFFLVDEIQGEDDFFERRSASGVAFTVLVPAK